ncbi:hypothetical protein B0H67DRAFT_548736 [Lasiosphaeris hirsuta]|uniref:Ankyrin repeat protein n=1 Tax=Lasiosphaeris hirsuta TaxID=260670 RepID=A0AA40BAU2_9PEZI|nr:hypothetical protein B0H67DRAFT_548736 [Lasiosphaeris hirsuta]
MAPKQSVQRTLRAVCRAACARRKQRLRTRFLWTGTLHHATYYHDNVEFIRPLLQAGAQLEGKSKAQGTPLSRGGGGQQRRDRRVPAGPGGPTCTTWTRTATRRCQRRSGTRYSCHAFLRILLRRHVDYRIVTNTQSTILHIAAQHGDEDLSRILAAHSLRGLDAEATDGSGKTAAELLAERVGTPPGLHEAFTRLVEEVALANEESSTDGSYMDALGALEGSHASLETWVHIQDQLISARAARQGEHRV